MKKGETKLRNKMLELGIPADHHEDILDMMREWAINDIIQVDEFVYPEAPAAQELNHIFDIANQYKSDMRHRVKSQTK